MGKSVWIEMERNKKGLWGRGTRRENGREEASHDVELYVVVTFVVSRMPPLSGTHGSNRVKLSGGVLLTLNIPSRFL
jgi:hypothetical protein